MCNCWHGIYAGVTLFFGLETVAPLFISLGWPRATPVPRRNQRFRGRVLFAEDLLSTQKKGLGPPSQPPPPQALHGISAHASASWNARGGPSFLGLALGPCPVGCWVLAPRHLASFTRPNRTALVFATSKAPAASPKPQAIFGLDKVSIEERDLIIVPGHLRHRWNNGKAKGGCQTQRHCCLLKPARFPPPCPPLEAVLYTSLAPLANNRTATLLSSFANLSSPGPEKIKNNRHPRTPNYPRPNRPASHPTKSGLASPRLRMPRRPRRCSNMQASARFEQGPNMHIRHLLKETNAMKPNKLSMLKYSTRPLAWKPNW